MKIELELKLLDENVNELGNELSRIIVVIAENDPVDTTKLFEHTFKRTYDPADRFDKINKFLSSEYFMNKDRFSDSLFATFPKKSTLAKKIIKDGSCILDFIHLSTNYRLVWCDYTD